MLSETSSTSTRKIPPTTSPGAQDPTIPDPLVVGGIQKANKNIPHLGQHRRGPDATTKWRRFFLVILPCRLWRHNNTRVETVQGSLVIQFRAKMMTWYVMICINYQLFQKKMFGSQGYVIQFQLPYMFYLTKKTGCFLPRKIEKMHQRPRQRGGSSPDFRGRAVWRCDRVTVTSLKQRPVWDDGNQANQQVIHSHASVFSTFGKTFHLGGLCLSMEVI